MTTDIIKSNDSLPQSMLLSSEKLSSTLQAQDPEFVRLVFIRHQKGMSIEKAVATSSPTFFDVTNFFSKDSMLFWLRFHIAETFAFLGIYDRASVYQIRETAELITNHAIYGQFTLDEFLCFLQRFKMGLYGKIYNSNRPNPQEFLACLKPFWEELSHERGRAEEKRRIEQLSHDRHSIQPLTPEQRAHIEEIQQRIAERFSLNNEK